MRKEILSGKRVAKHERFYKQYFQIKETPIRGLQVTVIEEAVKLVESSDALPQLINAC